MPAGAKDGQHDVHGCCGRRGAGDGVPEVDGDAVGEACRDFQHPLLASEQGRLEPRAATTADQSITATGCPLTMPGGW